MPLLHTLRATAVALACCAAAASASAADFTFTGTTDPVPDSSPLASTAFSGSFSFDGSAASANGDLALTAFSLTFGGQTWTLADLDSGAVAVFDNGTSLGLAVNAGSNDLSARPGVSFLPGWYPGDVGYFSYNSTDGKGDLLGFGSVSFTDVTPAVPEPGTYAMLLAGLGAVGVLARRRRA